MIDNPVRRYHYIVPMVNSSCLGWGVGLDGPAWQGSTRVAGFGVRLVLLLLLWIGVPMVAGATSAESDYQTALTYLQDTRNISIDSALIYFHSALATDPNHGAANVFAAVLELAQSVDDARVANLRAAFSSGRDSATLSHYISRAVGLDEHFDSIFQYRRYSWGSDPRPSKLQYIIHEIVSETIPHMESHLIAAENANAVFDFPRNLIDESGKGADTFEIDKTEIMGLHSVLLIFKAALVVLTSYNVDVTETPTNVPDTTSPENFRRNHPALFETYQTWDTAWKALKSADSYIYAAGAFLQSESDSQDTDLLRLTSIDTHANRYIEDTKISRYNQWHSDTFDRIFYRGDSVTADPDKANRELGGVSFAPETLFASPPDRHDFNELSDLRGRGPEWNDIALFDPTLGGILPGMTMNRLFLHTHSPETYFIIGSEQSIDLNSIYSNHVPDIVDLQFSSASTVSLQRRNSSSSGHFWRMEITPAETGHHLRIIFDDAKHFRGNETFKIRRYGDFAGPAVRVVPWIVSGGSLSDAGSSSSNFSTYFSSFVLKWAWTPYPADTLQMFAMPNARDQFDSIATSVSSSSDSSLVLGTASQLGWFAAGAPATSGDSVFLFGVEDFLTGETSARLNSDFSVFVGKLRIYNDTHSRFGFFTERTLTPLAGVVVTFSIFDRPSGAAGATLDTSSAVTNDSGLAFTRLVLGDKAGVYVVRASLSSDSGGGDVILFATSEGVVPWVSGDWNIFSLARRPSTLTASAVLSNSTFSSGHWKMYEQDPAADRYAEPTTLEMGEGYWLKTLTDGFINLSSASDVTDTQYIDLTEGWNLIGIPFEEVYPIDRLLVQTLNGALVSLDTAADSALLVNRFYTFEGSNSYEACPDATFGRTSCYFYPYQGQWVRALAACTIVVPPPSTTSSVPTLLAPKITTATYRAPSLSAFRSPPLLTTAPLAAKHADNWTLQLIASAGKFTDMMNAVGVRPTPGEAIFKAPRAPSGVHLGIRNGAAVYSSVFCTPKEKAEWQFEVSTASTAMVTVRVSNIGSVPDDIPLTLTDLATGAQTDVRSSPAYSFAARAGDVRYFSLSTEDRGLFGKAKLPAACVVARWVGGRSVVSDFLRRGRDAVLEYPAGRRLAAAYYGASRP